MFKVIFHMPRMVRSRLDHIQRNFLWEGQYLEEKTPPSKAADGVLGQKEWRSRREGPQMSPIRHSSASGASALRKKVEPYGIMQLGLIIVRRRGDGAHAK